MTPRHEAVHRLMAEGKLKEARAAALRLAQGSPRDALAALLLSEIHERIGELPQAAHWAERAASLNGPSAAAQARAGRLCALVDRRAPAEAHLRRALDIEPGDIASRGELASLLALGNRYGEMARVVEEGLALDGGSAALSGLLAGAMLNLARPEAAAALLRELCGRFPDDAGLANGYALVLNYVPSATPEEIFAAHRRFGELLTRGAGEVSRIPPRVISGGPIRVGLISPDLRAHSVAWFAEPLLRHHDRGRMELVVYQTNYEADEVTTRLRPLAAAWHVMDRATDAMLAERLRGDGLDAVVELSGLTQGHALGALVSRPVPLQATYLGYPNTTGLPCIDLRLVDSRTDPPGAEAYAAEGLARLDPCFLCYAPPSDAPSPERAAAGSVTFGSFNSAQKLNGDVLALWARVLEATPGSRLLLKAVNFEDGALRDDVRSRLGAAGVEPSRVDVIAPIRARGAHLEAYSRIDVALDPTPYAGTTTTCEALWMGVPVVTLAGRTHAGRVGVSLLHAVGRPEWIARDADEYVAVATRLAGERDAHATGRAGLRQRVKDSPLCDGPAFARRFEQALRDALTERRDA